MPPDQKHKHSYNYMQGCLELLLLFLKKKTKDTYVRVKLVGLNEKFKLLRIEVAGVF